MILAERKSHHPGKVTADLGLSDEPREDHAAYLASWLKVLRDDNRAIVTAAAAQRAVHFMHEKAQASPQIAEQAAELQSAA